MNISDKNHPHHAVWREHVQSVLDGEPKEVQWRDSENCEWLGAPIDASGVVCLAWAISRQYRIKPRTITRTINYPEPMKVAPEFKTKYWFINAAGLYGIDLSTWMENTMDFEVFKRGMAFATEADAKAAAQAIFGIES